MQRSIETATTFETVAGEYLEKRQKDGKGKWAPATLAKNTFLLGLLTPTIGRLPIAEIIPADVLAAVRKIEAKGNLETARRALQLSSAVFRHAVATARLASDPTRDLKGALTPPEVKNRAAILDPLKLGELLRAIDGYEGNASTRHALAIAPHLFVRPGELRQACWEEFDLDEAVWTIPAAKTKMRKAHYVPLSRQAIVIIAEARSLTSRKTGYVFPSIRTSARPISENTLNAATRTRCEALMRAANIGKSASKWLSGGAITLTGCGPARRLCRSEGGRLSTIGTTHCPAGAFSIHLGGDRYQATRSERS